MKVLVKNNVQEQIMSDVNKDLKSFLINYEKEYITNQSIIGWEQAFRGYIVKVWRFDCIDRFFNQEN